MDIHVLPSYQQMTAKLNQIFRNKVISLAQASGENDPAHDVLHFERVVHTATELAKAEGADLNIVIPAAWLHDYVVISKNDPRRSQASKLSAEAAISYLQEINYPKEFYAGIAHAIEAHSFSANIETRTLEAKVVQDADRLDGIGAIGIARVFIVAGLLRRPLYADHDVFAEKRDLNDREFTIDHFYQKLLKVPEQLKTESAKAEGKRRLEIMQRFLNDLKHELPA